MARAKTTKAVGDLSRWETGIDTAKTRQLISDLAVSSKKPWFEPVVGKDKYVSNFLRVCPKHPDWENPWNIVPVHYLGSGNSTRMVVCTKEANIGGECPACIIRWDLHEGGDDQGARGLRVSIRSFLNVLKIDASGQLTVDEKTGEVDETIYILSLNQIQFLGKRQVTYDLDEESELPLFFFFEKYGDISSVSRGRDLLVKCKEDRSGDYKTIAMKFSVADEESPFPGTFEMLEGEGFNDLQAVAQLASAEEVMQIIEGRSPTALPAASAVPQITGPSGESRFGGGDDADEEKTTADPTPDAPSTPEPTPAGVEAGGEPAEEEKPENPRASRTAPKTNQQEAISRLREAQEKGA